MIKKYYYALVYITPVSYTHLLAQFVNRTVTVRNFTYNFIMNVKNSIISRICRIYQCICKQISCSPLYLSLIHISINTPNSETVAAMLETERMLRDPNLKAYDVEDALKELKS